MIKPSVTSFVLSPVAVILLAGMPASVSAQEDAEDAYTEFSDAYAAYTSAIEAGDQASALRAANASYELGQAQFGRVSANTAALALNYGNLLVSAGIDNSLAAELFKEADEIYEELHGDASAERIEALLALAAIQETHDEKLDSINALLAMHRAVFPDDDLGFAALQTHCGQLLADAVTGSLQAQEMLAEALDTLEAELGDDSPELIATLFALGSATSNQEVPSRRQKGYFDRAVEIADNASSFGLEAVADLEIQVALKLARQWHGDREALPYIRSALDKYDRLFGADHPKTAFALVTLGQAYIATDDSEQGVIHVQEAIDFYDGNPAYVANLLGARQVLLAVYLSEGDDLRYDEQLMEIARLSEGVLAPVEYLPIVRVAPIYPENAAQQGIEGYVIVQYTIDEEGRTRDLVILESDSGRGSPDIFHAAALRSARQYRYLPTFENGVPVSVPGITTKINFELEN